MEIHCHDGARHSELGGPVRWRPAETSREDGYEPTPFRTCSYCGSIHPEDLIAAVEAGARMHGSDWKYGWPHKFYVEKIPNPNKGMKIRVGSRSHMENGERKEEIMWGTAGEVTHGKWYNVHLEDFDDEFFAKMSKLLYEQAGILFERDEKGVKYSAPHDGYQKC